MLLRIERVQHERCAVWYRMIFPVLGVGARKTNTQLHFIRLDLAKAGASSVRIGREGYHRIVLSSYLFEPSGIASYLFLCTAISFLCFLSPTLRLGEGTF